MTWLVVNRTLCELQIVYLLAFGELREKFLVLFFSPTL